MLTDTGAVNRWKRKIDQAVLNHDLLVHLCTFGTSNNVWFPNYGEHKPRKRAVRI